MVTQTRQFRSSRLDEIRRRRSARQARELASTLTVSIEPITPVEQPTPSRDQPLEDANRGFFGSLADVIFTPMNPESAVDSLSNVPIIGRPLNLAGEVIQELSTPFDIGLTVASAGLGPAAFRGLTAAGFKGSGALASLPPRPLRRHLAVRPERRGSNCAPSRDRPNPKSNPHR